MFNRCTSFFFSGDSFISSHCGFFVHKKAALRRLFLFLVTCYPLVYRRQLISQQPLLFLYIVALHICPRSNRHIETVLRNGGVRPGLHRFLLRFVDSVHLAFQSLIERDGGTNPSRQPCDSRQTGKTCF